MIEYWIGALCYTFQIYFDFSGYSDMAIGLARMFGVTLPENFYSPYKSSSIIDFWRRWHITLSRFLRDYIYIPIGGARNGVSRKFVNIFITMLIGGLWHGAGWTFVVWGAIHALYITINHAWRSFLSWLDFSFSLLKPVNIAVTFIAVIIAWVFFRADSFDASITIVHGMFDLNGWTGLNGLILNAASLYKSILWICLGMFIVFVLPNTQEIFHKYHVVYESVRVKSNRFIAFSISSRWGAIVGLFLLMSLVVMQTEISTFIYFEF
ncbi:hypothetical protein GCM10023116_21900 [Kistimonas scapharcae]|uniref:Probable alginate O-acetylase AlgI n=1 Tax=Kistimonas scapharcae TaxID=1036133 RepID=A0ABP8V2W2_9GAMM